MARNKHIRGKPPKLVVEFERCCRALMRPKELADAPDHTVDANGDFQLDDSELLAAYRATCEFPTFLHDKSVRKRIRDQPSLIKKLVPCAEFWIFYFTTFINEYELSFLPPDSRGSPATDLCRFIASFRDIEVTLPCITGCMEDAYLFTFIVNTWMAQDESTFGGAMDGSADVLNIDQSSPYPTVAMTFFLEVLDVNNDSSGGATDWIVHIAGGSAMVVADSVVKRFTKLLRNPPTYLPVDETSLSLIDHVEAHISLIRCLLAVCPSGEYGRPSALREHLCRSGIVPCLVRAMLACVDEVKMSNPLHPSRLQRLYGLATTTLTQLNAIILSKQSSNRILEMLDTDILKSLAEIWLLEKGNCAQRTSIREEFVKMFSIFETHLHNIDILGASISAFDQLCTTHPNTIKQVPNLMNLRAAVLDRSVVKGMFSRRENIAGDMIRAHRREGCASTCTFCDFVLFLAKQDLLSCFTDVEKRAKQQWPGVDWMDLAIQVTYNLPQFDSVQDLEKARSPTISTILHKDLPKRLRKLRRECPLEGCACDRYFVVVRSTLDGEKHEAAHTGARISIYDGPQQREEYLKDRGRDRKRRGISRVSKLAPDGYAYEMEPWDDIDEVLSVVYGLGGIEASYDMIDNTVLAMSISKQLQQTEIRKTVNKSGTVKGR